MINGKCPGDNPSPPPQSNRERRIMISNPNSPKIPGHLSRMLIFTPSRFHTEHGVTAGQQAALLWGMKDFCHRCCHS